MCEEVVLLGFGWMGLGPKLIVGIAQVHGRTKCNKLALFQVWCLKSSSPTNKPTTYRAEILA